VKNRLFFLRQLEQDISKTSDDLEQESRTFTAAIRRKYASQGIALKDGSYPIPDKDALRRAIRAIGRGGKAKYSQIKAHILKRAKALGATSMLPDSWGVGQETQRTSSDLALQAETSLQWMLTFGDQVPKPLILEDKTDLEGDQGYLRIRAPFYVGESVNVPPHFDRKVIFPTAVLQETVAEGKQQIKAGVQPLTVYSRHSAAQSNGHLPIGGIVDLAQEGRVGYATIDLVNEGDGRVAIGLLKHEPPLLNAISLRARPGRFEMEHALHEEEKAYRVTKLLIDGVDFAPDSPAMATYGIEVLQETADKGENNPKKEDNLDLTLERLRTEHGSLVAEIEHPLVQEVEQRDARIKVLEQELQGFKDAQAKREIAKLIDDIAGNHAKKAEVVSVLQEMVRDCKTKEEAAVILLPVMQEILAKQQVVPVETAKERLSKLFNAGQGGGRGKSNLEQERVDGTPDDDDSASEYKQSVGPLGIPE